MTTDTPRTDAARFEALRGAALRQDCIPLKLGEELERELNASKAEVERLKNGFQGSCYCCEPVGEMNQKLEAEVERLKTLMHQTIWFVDDMIKTHTNGCEHCLKKHGAMIALFKDITEEPQWPVDPTDTK